MRSTRSMQILRGAELDAMRRSCLLAAATLVLVEREIKPGMSTAALDRLVHDYLGDHGAYPAPLNYPDRPTDPARPVISRGSFPRSVCTSINEVVCHGIPSEREVLREGDIVNVDVTGLLDGFYGDSSMTFCIGDVKPGARRLVEVARRSLDIGIEQVRPGGHIGDIGAAIQEYAEGEGYGVVREYCGHGVGRVFHTEPQVSHVGKRGTGERMMVGMCFTIEPMINAGTWRTRLDPGDQWTVRTADRKLSAQWEHSVVVTRDGVEILTDRTQVAGSEFDPAR